MDGDFGPLTEEELAAMRDGGAGDMLVDEVRTLGYFRSQDFS